MAGDGHIRRRYRTCGLNIIRRSSRRSCAFVFVKDGMAHDDQEQALESVEFPLRLFDDDVGQQAAE